MNHDDGELVSQTALDAIAVITEQHPNAIVIGVQITVITDVDGAMEIFTSTQTMDNTH